MKKVFLFSIAIILFSCAQDESLNVDLKNQSDLEIREHIYFATWDKFGRPSKDCDGW